MQIDLANSLRELSEVYDETSNNSFVSLYINKNVYPAALSHRMQVCHNALSGDERKNYDATMDEIKDALKKVVWDHIAVFASKKHNFLKYVVLPLDVENSLVVDSSPYIRPLARIHDEWESFTLILLSSDFAKIYSVALGRVTQEKKLSIDLMNKHKKGGFSQARFQRLRKGAIHAFFTDVLEALQKHADNEIILAGPGQAKNQFFDMLPKHLKDSVVEVVDIDARDETQLLKRSIDLMKEKEHFESSNAVKHLKEEIVTDGLAVYGVDETLAAVRNGQVELLIIEKDFRASGWICEQCQIVRVGRAKVCSNCGGSVSEVDVLEEILEFAERTDAKVEFTGDPEIADLGHVGGILRYK